MIVHVSFSGREIFGHYLRNVILPYVVAVRRVFADPDALGWMATEAIFLRD